MALAVMDITVVMDEMEALLVATAPVFEPLIRWKLASGRQQLDERPGKMGAARDTRLFTITALADAEGQAPLPLAMMQTVMVNIRYHVPPGDELSMKRAHRMQASDSLKMFHLFDTNEFTNPAIRTVVSRTAGTFVKAGERLWILRMPFEANFLYDGGVT